MQPSYAKPLLLVVLPLALAGCWGSTQAQVPKEHTTKVLSAVATAEGDLKSARALMKEGRHVDALRTVLNRLKALDTQLYDEYQLKSKAYNDGHLPTVKAYAGLIRELEAAEHALLLYLNEPLSVILQQILLKHPDPRAREEALDIIAGSANEVFTRFKAGYRQELLDNLEVRAEGENNLALRTKMLQIIETLQQH